MFALMTVVVRRSVYYILTAMSWSFYYYFYIIARYLLIRPAYHHALLTDKLDLSLSRPSTRLFVGLFQRGRSTCPKVFNEKRSAS